MCSGHFRKVEFVSYAISGAEPCARTELAKSTSANGENLKRAFIRSLQGLDSYYRYQRSGGWPENASIARFGAGGHLFRVQNDHLRAPRGDLRGVDFILVAAIE